MTWWKNGKSDIVSRPGSRPVPKANRLAYLGHTTPTHKISWKSVHNLLSNPALIVDRQTDKTEKTAIHLVNKVVCENIASFFSGGDKDKEMK